MAANIFDDLYLLKHSQARVSAEILARAFFNDPLFLYLFPDSDKRIESAALILEYWLRHDLFYGEVYAPSEKLEGLAAWVRSDKGGRTLFRMLRSGAYPLYRQLERITSSKHHAYHENSSELQKSSISGRYWCLELFGMEPENKGKGYGGYLLRPMLERAQRECLPCFVETENPANISLYEHFGFKVTKEVIIPGSNFKIFGMVKSLS